VNGVAYELPCATSLVFDEHLGTCTRPEQASEFAKVCPEKLEKGKYIIIHNLFIIHKYMNINCAIHKHVLLFTTDNIAGFSCPDEKVLSIHGQALAHPSFPHPLSCQKFITCYFSKDIRELGCMKGQVFDYTTLKCSDPEGGPKDW
jgi:hypothetical protein